MATKILPCLSNVQGLIRTEGSLDEQRVLAPCG
jgi:hypothetical protein